jgi:hypothetical protein
VPLQRRILAFWSIGVTRAGEEKVVRFREEALWFGCVVTKTFRGRSYRRMAMEY